MRPFTSRQRHGLLAVLALILLIRLLSLGAYPLTDTSEARYGEMVRKMVELGDWVTPWFDYGIPFWGKPPLAFWLSAVSAKLLGVSEFALRLPSFLLGLAMLGLTAGLARHERSPDHAVASSLALASCVLFFVASGAVLTDTVLAFTVTLAMVAFWRGVAAPDKHARAWRYALFAALGLGLLAKGPVALILTGAPIFIWALLTKQVWACVRALPWAGGVTVMLLIALPWYWLAEQRTPGFLDYFLIGENYQRFTDPGWAGDRYGTVHTRPMGYIWLLWLIAALPWWPWLLAALGRGLWAKLRAGAPTGQPAFFHPTPWRLYLLCFAAAPGLFFTFSGSVLATYLLPGMPALALLLAEVWFSAGPRRPLGLALGAMALPIVFTLAVPLFNAQLAADKSQKTLLSHLPQHAAVVYYPKRPFSAQFYSQGRALQAADVSTLLKQIEACPQTYVVTSAAEVLPAAFTLRYRVRTEAGRRHRMVLWEPVDLPPDAASQQPPATTGCFAMP